MKNSITAWKVRGFIFTGILGVLLHFLFDWTNQNRIVALFSAVNESTWEHMKLLFFPMLIFSVIEARNYHNSWSIKLIGIISGTLLIPVLFYSLNGIFGKTPDVINIIIFFLSSFFSYFIEAKLLQYDIVINISESLSILILCLIAILFAIFTFYPPELPVFMDPISGTYGI